MKDEDLVYIVADGYGYGHGVVVDVICPGYLYLVVGTDGVEQVLREDELLPREM